MGHDEEELGWVGIWSTSLRLHSFSSRGAASIETKLRKNPSRERLLKLHSRWKSDSAEDMYVKEQVQERLDVDKIAGI